MTDQLRTLFREVGERIEVSPPPITAILDDGSRRSRVSRTRGLIAAAASVVLIAGGVAGLNRLQADDARDPSPDVATNSPSPSATAPGSIAVSRSGVGRQAFGTDADEVIPALTDRLGEPDLVVGPQRYHRIAGSDGWFEVAEDPISLSWQYPTVSVTCWGRLCLVFGGADADSLRLRGWELSDVRRWSGFDDIAAERSPDVRLAGTGITLGDAWKRLHAAYPDTEAGGGEGASVVVSNTPWTGVFDGVGEWRLSGEWDYARPDHAPTGAKVTRLSAGKGPEPGCC